MSPKLSLIGPTWGLCFWHYEVSTRALISYFCVGGKIQSIFSWNQPWIPSSHFDSWHLHSCTKYSGSTWSRGILWGLFTCSSLSMSSAGVRTTSSLSPSESCPKRSSSSVIFSEIGNLVNKRTHTVPCFPFARRGNYMSGKGKCLLELSLAVAREFIDCGFLILYLLATSWFLVIR